MQFIVEWMKVHCIANFTYGFRKTIWKLVKSLKVMLTAGQAWQMADPIFHYKACATNQLLVNINAFAMGVTISFGIHTRSGSTMINTPWHAKIDAQDLFYFMILPVGGTLIDLAVSMKARLELYTDAHETLIFDN